MSPDIKRLKDELATLWMAIQQELEEEEPSMPRRDRKQLARSRFVQVVDDAVREISV